MYTYISLFVCIDEERVCIAFGRSTNNLNFKLQKLQVDEYVSDSVIREKTFE